MEEKNAIVNRETGRIEYIDIFRAFGIILMVMGHIGFGGLFDHMIHAFHMPMFFFVSGFLYKNNNNAFLPFIKKKAKSLLLPYVIFGIFHYFYYSIINGSFSIAPLRALLLFPTNGSMPIAGALWFLLALFLSDILYFWINKIRNNRIQWIVVIIVSITGQIIPERINIILPFGLGAAMVGIGLMHIGRVLRPYEKVITDLKIYQILVFGVLIALSIKQSDYINMRVGDYSIIFIVFWVNAVSASILGLNVAKRLKEILKDGMVNKYLQSVGKNSIVYLCLNQIVIKNCGKIVRKLLEKLSISGDSFFPSKVFTLAGSLVVLFLLSILIEKTILKILIGRSITKKKNETI